jgi:hypothetical protein
MINLSSELWKRIHDGKFKYELVHSVYFQFPFLKLNDNYVIQDIDNKIVGYIYVNGVVVLYPGYKWDGATAAPDFPSILLAAAFHDLFCQIEHDISISRSITDQTFVYVAKYYKAPLMGRIYYMGIMVGRRVLDFVNPFSSNRYFFPTKMDDQFVYQHKNPLTQ